MDIKAFIILLMKFYQDVHPNKRMQSDIFTRYARENAADAER